MQLLLATLLIGLATAPAPTVASASGDALRARVVSLGERDQAAMRAPGGASKEVLQSHVDELVQLIALHGWPKKSVVGEAGAQAAWLVVQHADFDPSFQRRALQMMETLIPLDEVNPRDIAYLRDRVAHGEGRAQVYGTQGKCSGTTWEPFAIASPGQVDQRRKEATLEPLADYIARASRAMCANARH